jgi:hypothetical protein
MVTLDIYIPLIDDDSEKMTKEKEKDRQGRCQVVCNSCPSPQTGAIFLGEQAK